MTYGIGVPKDPFLDLSQVLKMPNVKIFCNEAVLSYKDSNFKNGKPCNFLMATFGLLIFNRKLFRKPKIISISFLDLSSVQISNQNLSFVSENVIIRITHLHAYELGTFAYFYKQLIFPKSFSPITLTLDKKLFLNFDTSSFTYQSDDIFMDRLSSCIFKYNIEKFPPLHFEYPSKENNYLDGSFTITQAMMSHPLFRPLILALSYEDHLKEIQIVDNVPLRDLIPLCYTLFSINTSVERVTFQNPNFANADKALKSTFSIQNMFRPSQFNFIMCDLTMQNISFFEVLSQTVSELVSLQFMHCNFDKSSMRKLFQVLNFNNPSCFHSLESLSFVGISDTTELTNGLIQLTRFDWTNIPQLFNSLSICYCNVEASYLISAILINETGVNFLSLKHCMFLIPIPSNLKISYSTDIFSDLDNDDIDQGKNILETNHEIDTRILKTIDLNASVQTHQLEELNLEGCRFTAESILSLFIFLTQELVSVKKLDLSYMKIEKDEFNFFLDPISEFKLHNLKTLIFNGNTMNSDQLLKFNSFLVKQEKLTKISLNGSISTTTGKNGLTKLLDIIISLNIDQISLRGVGLPEFDFGDSLPSFFEALSRKGTLLSLDISQQSLSKQGISNLIILLNTTPVQELYFDGIKCPGFDCLFDLFEEIILSNLHYASWPYLECERLKFEITDAVKLQNIQAMINHYHSQFDQKFTNPSSKYSKNNKFDLSSFNKTRNKIELQYFDPETMSNRNDEIDSVYKECIDTVQFFYEEPILKTISEFEHEISFKQIENNW